MISSHLVTRIDTHVPQTPRGFCLTPVVSRTGKQTKDAFKNKGTLHHIKTYSIHVLSYSATQPTHNYKTSVLIRTMEFYFVLTTSERFHHL